MDAMKVVEILARWVHIGAAAYWLTLAFYMWRITRAELEIEGSTFVSYAAQMSRVSGLGKGLAISSGLTIVAGLVLYGQLKYWTRGFDTLGPIIFNIGVLVGVIASAYTGMVFARSGRVGRAILAEVKGTPTDAQVSAYRANAESLLSKMPMHFGIVAFAFLAMIAGAAM